MKHLTLGTAVVLKLCVCHFSLLISLEVMDQNVEYNEVNEGDVSMKTPIQVTKDGQYDKRSNRCNQCQYASSHIGNFKMHLKMHNGEKSEKCNQCSYATSHAGTLKRHLKMHSGEKSNQCNQCDFTSLYSSNLRQH